MSVVKLKTKPKVSSTNGFPRADLKEKRKEWRRFVKDLRVQHGDAAVYAEWWKLYSADPSYYEEEFAHVWCDDSLTAANVSTQFAETQAINDAVIDPTPEKADYITGNGGKGGGFSPAKGSKYQPPGKRARQGFQQTIRSRMWDQWVPYAQKYCRDMTYADFTVLRDAANAQIGYNQKHVDFADACQAEIQKKQGWTEQTKAIDTISDVDFEDIVKTKWNISNAK